MPTQLPSSSFEPDYSQQENINTKKNFDYHQNNKNCGVDNSVKNQFDEEVYANFLEIIKHDEVENIDRR